ncbi:hypothetical protein LOAG_11479 [Loa loa]|uniref:RING-type domain-containing protein n=1 Tax=Loa loa TaxID=7209 RepID=A0A1S0TMZ2_LOALO|nr:hypothetical protein LOAG_11479 [Loa loa]EFO17025.2 hypothetical protein LOAG_11479 [Loa loa]
MECPVCRKKLKDEDWIKFLSFNFRQKQLMKNNPELVMFQHRILQQLNIYERKNENGKIKREMYCTVCMKRLHFTNIAALRCCHTFHLSCISQHVKNDGKCPVCYKKAEEDSIIPRLFFEIDKEDDNNFSISYAQLRQYIASRSWHHWKG